jgi:apolipoprotein N-acyltransferase
MGEYIPGPWFVEALIAWMSPWESDYELSPGEGPVVFTLPGGWQVGAPICYEDAVAGICRKMVYGPDGSGSGGKRLDLLVNLTNDGWYPGKGMRRQHAQLASLRCIENRVPMARSVNTGISAVIDSVGRSSVRLDAYEAGVLVHAVQIDERSTLYGTLGGWPWALFVLFGWGSMLFATFFGRPIAKHRIA